MAGNKAYEASLTCVKEVDLEQEISVNGDRSLATPDSTLKKRGGFFFQSAEKKGFYIVK